MAKKAEKVATEDRTFQIGEMISSIEQTIFNIENVMKQQNELIELIESSDKKDRFEEFVNESKGIQKNYEDQIKKLSIKIEFLNKVEDAVKNSEEVKAAVNDLLIGLGVFDA